MSDLGVPRRESPRHWALTSLGGSSVAQAQCSEVPGGSLQGLGDEEDGSGRKPKPPCPPIPGLEATGQDLKGCFCELCVMPGFVTSRGKDFHPGSEMRLDDLGLFV